MISIIDFVSKWNCKSIHFTFKTVYKYQHYPTTIYKSQLFDAWRRDSFLNIAYYFRVLFSKLKRIFFKNLINVRNRRSFQVILASTYKRFYDVHFSVSLMERRLYKTTGLRIAYGFFELDGLIHESIILTLNL